MPQRSIAAPLALAVLTASLSAASALTLPAVAAPGSSARPGLQAGDSGGLASHDSAYYSRPRPLDRRASEAALREARRSAGNARGAGTVGHDKIWPAVDFVSGALYLKHYRLRGQGKHIQVWVANDRAFPTDDCRNDLGLTDVTNAQVKAFIRQFDHRILPLESKAFSVAPPQNGSGSAPLAKALELPADYWKVGKRHADDTVVLIDNVRDENYFTPDTPEGQTRVGGFFTQQYTSLFDRNMMTVDSYNWLHASGANPPDDSHRRAYRACGKELGVPAGRFGSPDPRSYEATFAHEYQHLLESYQDPDEVSWVNEGLSDYAQTVVGYVNTRISPAKKTADGHLRCFDGFLGRRFGGPENSLTAWEDQENEVLCDYGAAYSFMQYLSDQYGGGFLKALHRENGNGIRGLDRVLHRRTHASSLGVFHRWSAMSALDGALDRNGGRLVGGKAGRYRAASLHSRIKWSNPESYNAPGAPLNGSDFVRLRDAAGKYLTAGDLHGLTFDGSTTLPPTPVEWTVDSTPPDATTAATTCGTVPDGTGAAALYSGCGNDLDRSIVRQVSIPAGGTPTLSFQVLFDTEEAWDFGFVQVSTDGGASWTSLATRDTTQEHNADAAPEIVAQLPGFTGDSGTWRHETADLSAYAGKDVLIGFRYMTDPAAAEAGMFVRGIDVAGTPLPSGTLTGWRTITQAHPVKVPGFTVQLVSYGNKRVAHLSRLHLDAAFDGSLTGAALRKELGRTGTTVGAIVTADDPTEGLTGEARYRLSVNGVLQPGGGATP